MHPRTCNRARFYGESNNFREENLGMLHFDVKS